METSRWELSPHLKEQGKTFGIYQMIVKFTFFLTYGVDGDKGLFL